MRRRYLESGLPSRKSAKQLIGLMFRIQNEPGQYKFNIKYFGTKADGCAGSRKPGIYR